MALKLQHYKFKNESNEYGGYALLKDKNKILLIDIGILSEKSLVKTINLEVFI